MNRVDAGRYERHLHRGLVTFRDGSSVTAVSFAPDGPYERERRPDFGVYLDPAWSPPWPHRHVVWPDFGVPDDLDDLAAALADLLTRARRGESVEIGRLGGHGRTGTALACLAVLAGTPREEAVDWVRATYCPHAVETHEQLALVRDFNR